MRHDGFIKNHTADGAIGAYRIVKHGDADGDVAQATASTDVLIGVNGRLAAAVAGDRVDIHRGRLVEVEYGGNVTRGDPLTSDANAKAVAAAPAAGTNAYIIGYAEVSGVAGDIGAAMFAPGRIQG